MALVERSTLFNVRRKADGHELKIREYFEGRIGGGARPIGVPTVFMLFTNRCGSSYFADLLRTTGLYNRAGEPLNWDTVIKRSEQLGCSTFAEYLLGLEPLAAGRCLAIKASLGQYDFLRRAGLLRKIFPGHQVIVTERSDKIGQAVSWVIAAQTKQWTSQQPSQLVSGGIAYDFKAIRNYVAEVSNTHRDMDIYLALHGENYCRVLYEDVVADPPGQVARVLKFLGHGDAKVKLEEVSLKKQSDDRNTGFRERFIADVLAAKRPGRKPGKAAGPIEGAGSASQD